MFVTIKFISIPIWPQTGVHMSILQQKSFMFEKKIKKFASSKTKYRKV